ncbi:DUF6264 family protein [Subtercola boreus]|uniref:Uncharacterized protein n=1 Tax=Subtercola boreus TaxID=120213 RepID=A0A3E0WBQ6_9MICO|nr:DUF6264 family protein [Subtercola boreus]RFA20021.1 hypothetical protein B7R24_10585 [Subtercola boreus]RFA20150.1 hypothetical protein B7R23_10525 [Subtercola boreus]RFA26477.1 hypothetical protein B7R25_10650 [Subtercola boreus]
MVDNRPKPKYGELAPEGWEWKPPAPPAGSDVPVPAAAGGDGQAPVGQPGAGVPPHGPTAPYSAAARSGYGAGAQGAGSSPTFKLGDAIATGALLFIGVLVSASMIPALFDFTTVLAQAAALQGYSDFSASSTTQSVGIGVGVATIILNLLSIVLSVRRVQRRRVAFFIPLIFGAVTFALWIGAITFAFCNDPGFVQSLTSTVAPTP